MKPYHIFFIFSLFIIVACNPKQTATSDNKSQENIVQDSLHLYLNVSEIDSIKIIFTDDESIQASMNKEHQRSLAEQLKVAEYDTLWNDSDIMIKMIAPDYTLIINYNEHINSENDILMLWRENRKVKFQNIWYILPDGKQQNIYNLLDSYRPKE